MDEKSDKNCDNYHSCHHPNPPPYGAIDLETTLKSNDRKRMSSGISRHDLSDNANFQRAFSLPRSESLPQINCLKNKITSNMV